LLLDPTFAPFLCHWYVGVPPLVGVAVNVTLVPKQIVLPGAAEMLTEGVTLAVTVIVIVLLLTVGVVTQVILLVIVTSTTSPFTRAASV
jgi:hypothetical protein